MDKLELHADSGCCTKQPQSTSWAVSARRWFQRGLFAATLAAFGANSLEAHAEIAVSVRQRVTASDVAQFKNFGTAVAIDGDAAVVGAFGDGASGANSGAVYLFVRSGGTWQRHPTSPKLTGTGALSGDFFGTSVALSGQSLVVGASGRSGGQGSVYLFRRASAAVTSAWVQEQQLTPSGLAAQDQFGGSVAISGDTVVIGAKGDTNSSGAAYVFVRGSTSPLWTQQGSKLVANPRAMETSFGFSVAVSGNSTVVGAPDQDGGGAVFTFSRSGSTWSTGQALTVPATLPALLNGDSFGGSVAVSSEWLLAGAPGADVNGTEDAGAAYLFRLIGGTWIARQRLDSANPTSSGQFGITVALANNRAAVGAPQESNGNGQAHLYSLVGTTWQRALSTLKSGVPEFVGFGVALGLSADGAVGGAGQEPCDTNGNCTAEGAAYLFGISDAPAPLPLLGPAPLLLLMLGLAGAGAASLRTRRARA